MMHGETTNYRQQPMRVLARIGIYALLIVASLIILLPLFFAASLALQGPTPTPTLLPNPHALDWMVFQRAFQTEPNLGRWIINSFVVATTVVCGVLVSSALAGYALAYIDFPGRLACFFFCLGTLMIPFEATIIPNYLFVAQLGWKDSYQGLIVPFLASGFGIFLLRQAFLTVPRDIYEAATMDGCSELRFLWNILLPLSRPTLATLAIYTFLGMWNQYYWPLLVTDTNEWRTTQVGITIFRTYEVQIFNEQMAATLIVTVPTLLLLLVGQRLLVGGLTAGAVKG